MRQDVTVERVLGIGGYFVRTPDQRAVEAWYRDGLGLALDQHGQWHQQPGPTVFAAFEQDTEYFGSPQQQVMLNFRVRDLDAMLAQLRLLDTEVVGEPQDHDGVGRFAWVLDPAGNRVELWQPA